MLDDAEQGRKEDRATYEARVPELRVELLNAQFDLREADFPVLLLVAGDDRIGCNAAVGALHEWMDARFLSTHAFSRPTDEERERPRFWRYWRVLPARGEMSLFVGAWPHALIADRMRGRLTKSGFQRHVEHVVRFEQTLVDDGALLLKFWLHLPKKELQKRLTRARKDPTEHWRIGAVDAALYENWGKVVPSAEQFLTRTNTEHAPWTIVESTDARHRNLTVAEAVLEALRSRLESKPDAGAARPPAYEPSPTEPASDGGVLANCDLTSTLARDRYEIELPKRQRRLRKLIGRIQKKHLAPVLVFEGWDAAGKGGVIRRITGSLDASDYRVVPIAAPTPEEKAHHYLWRFWRWLQRDGRILIFDRSWYGRVLVERVEGFAPEPVWRRAYDEILDFEAQLTESGAPVLKFWLHIDPDTQLERFRARETTPYKKYKITQDDYRNRERWPDYEEAIEEMVARTSTKAAPWHIVPANDKKYARISVLKIIHRAIDRALDDR